jgi:hypothetical protein
MYIKSNARPLKTSTLGFAIVAFHGIILQLFVKKSIMHKTVMRLINCVVEQLSHELVGELVKTTFCVNDVDKLR